jgi:signal transduction histidine kinase
MQPSGSNAEAETARLKRRLERERMTRLQAESISEQGLRELYEKKRQLQLLARIAAAANQTTSVTEVLEFAVIQVCEFTSWEVGHSYLVSGSAASLRLVSTPTWHAADPLRIAEFRHVTDEMEFKSGIGLPGRVLAIGRPLWVLDVTEDDNFPRRPFALSCGLKGASAFPVVSGEEVVAVLEFFSSVAREPNETLLELMSQIGLQLGRVIERQRAQDRLREWTIELTNARDDAKAADRAKSDFLATMGHELRTPLNAIIGFSELIKTEFAGPLGNDRYRDYADNIFTSGTHLLSLINNILDISKLDAEHLELNDEIVDLKTEISNCIETMTPLADKGHVVLSATFEAKLPLLRADKKRLCQILLNLISNAIKFTPENGKVRVSASCCGDGLVMAVADTGIGMAPDEVPKALERFGQIDSRLARKYEGTGLGLPLAKRLTELHGGVLRIESQINAGTMVSVVFPLERVVTSHRAA